MTIEQGLLLRLSIADTHTYTHTSLSVTDSTLVTFLSTGIFLNK